MAKKNRKSQLYVGTAGWNIPKQMRDEFFPPGAVKPNHLKAYADQLTGVEINSSFYREHQPSTYEKWAAATPDAFRFSVKLSKRFTHLQKLKIESSDLQTVIDGIAHLGEKLGVILIQLPPKLSFEGEVAEEFFAVLREIYRGPVALEPRHASWVTREANRMLEEFEICRVVADPDRIGSAPTIRSSEVAYFRLHGSPKVYYSDYEAAALARWTDEVRLATSAKQSVWCIFDNTALGHATANAKTLLHDVTSVKVGSKT